MNKSTKMTSAVSRATILIIFGLLVGATGANAGSIWRTATGDPDDFANTDDYTKAMSDGDDDALLAASESVSGARLKKLVLAAAREYELAAKARPDLAEPHWRAANVLFGFFFDCVPGAQATALCVRDSLPLSPEAAALARRIIEHWRAVERLDPLDPRLGASAGAPGVRFESSLLLTKLGAGSDLTAAIDEYVAWLQYASASDLSSPLVLGNLAELQMLTGHVEEAIATYDRSLERSRDVPFVIGLAVAYDRNDQPHMAMQTLETISAEEITDWRQKVQSGAVFYSPPDEYDYYEGLIAEFQGDLSTSLEQYSTFLKKTGTSAYVQRASEHVSDLARRLATNLAHANAL